MKYVKKEKAIREPEHRLLRELARAIRAKGIRKYSSRIADPAGISHSCVYDLLNGDRISLETAEKIGGILGLDLVWADRNRRLSLSPKFSPQESMADT